MLYQNRLGRINETEELRIGLSFDYIYNYSYNPSLLCRDTIMEVEQPNWQNSILRVTLAVAEDVHTDPNHRGLSGYALEKYYDEKKP